MKLTEREFWLNYWENKENLAIRISENYVLSDFLKKFLKENNIKSGIELGGFPGYYAIYFKKWLNIEATLLDYVIHPEILKNVLKENQLDTNDVTLIETDLFDFSPEKKYDLVMSVGLIEHFENTKEMIRIHTDFMTEDGVLFINLPNFRGFNGWLQRTFDYENYIKHNINSMDIQLLQSCCEDLNLKNIQVFYNGGFMMWLENIKTKSLIFRALFKTTWFCLKVLSKIIPIETKQFSPYINIIAYK
jgi:Methyltransferase domain